MPEWRAEIDLDEARVRSLIGGHFPELDLAGLAPLAEGWDNALWVTGAGIVFRFPRRAIARAGVEREIAMLPRLAPRLPLPIPVPLWVGEPSGAFPWPFFGARLVPGHEIASVSLDGRREVVGKALGAFLRTLHEPALVRTLGPGLARDPMRRTDMSERVPRTRQRLAALMAAGLWTRPPSVEVILGSAQLMGPASGAAVVHGDLHVRHVLVDDSGYPSGVIDWGDLCLADPAMDLSLYWSLLDPPARRGFAGAYRMAALTPERLLGARVLALFLNAALLAYAADVGDAALARETVAGLERTLLE
jgi:aminoglycoside phosphotransferase (APT) family kinase protein